MSMTQPMEPNLPEENDGIPAADAPEQTSAPEPERSSGTRTDPPFRTPEVPEADSGSSGTPVDPAAATSTPDPEQSGRGERAD
jgi:hypothetical protein